MLRDTFGSSFKGLVLYGSSVRGFQDAGSDIDLLVLFEDKTAADRERAKVSELAHQLLVKLNELVSPLPIGERECQRGRSHFFPCVKREGILIVPGEAFDMETEIEQLLEMAHSSLIAARNLLKMERVSTGLRLRVPTMPYFMRQEPRCCQRVSHSPDTVEA